MKSIDCSSGLHDYCHPCDCECHVEYLKCHNCGKQVSTGFFPVPTDTPDGGLIVRAWIECPECIEKSHATNSHSSSSRRTTRNTDGRGTE